MASYVLRVARRVQTQGLRVIATAVSDWGAAANEAEAMTMMGRPVRRVRNRIGSVNCRDLIGLELRIGDQVHLTIVLTLFQVGCDRLADDGSVERLQVYVEQGPGARSPVSEDLADLKGPALHAV